MTTLVHEGTTIHLPLDMLWVDEFEWDAVEQSKQYTVTGSLIVESGAKLAGRPITLAGDEQGGWLPRATLLSLMATAGVAGRQYTLTLRGVEYTVMFDTPPITASPVWGVSDPDAADHYVATLKFIEV